jgi:hypothetical protein
VRPSSSVSARRLELTAQASLWLSVLVVTVLFGWGAWQRRWIGDDGLIVLRTVRNLLAGNGPVFNMGERVEVNTSTLWTYLLYLGGAVGGPVRPGSTRRACWAAAQFCCRPVCWCTSRCRRRVTSRPLASKTV